MLVKGKCHQWCESAKQSNEKTAMSVTGLVCDEATMYLSPGRNEWVYTVSSSVSQSDQRSSTDSLSNSSLIRESASIAFHIQVYLTNCINKSFSICVWCWHGPSQTIYSSSQANSEFGLSPFGGVFLFLLICCSVIDSSLHINKRNALNAVSNPLGYQNLPNTTVGTSTTPSPPHPHDIRNSIQTTTLNGSQCIANRFTANISLTTYLYMVHTTYIYDDWLTRWLT